jgi:hypothetical protein
VLRTKKPHTTEIKECSAEGKKTLTE